MKIKKIVLIIVSVIGMIVLSGCGPHEDGEDGTDGKVTVTFYYDETDVIAIDAYGLNEDYETFSYTGADCIRAEYFVVENLNGSFSWATSDGEIHTQGVAFTIDKGTKGGKGHPPQNPGEFFLIIDNFGSNRGEDGHSGRDKYYVIRLQGATATIFNNTSSYFTDCPFSSY